MTESGKEMSLLSFLDVQNACGWIENIFSLYFLGLCNLLHRFDAFCLKTLQSQFMNSPFPRLNESMNVK